FFFLFSSRRRHTRSKRDWSSDVCSSDLYSLISITLLCLYLLKPLFINGECKYKHKSVMEIREYVNSELNSLWEEYRRLSNPQTRSEERRVGKECRTK